MSIRSLVCLAIVTLVSACGGGGDSPVEQQPITYPLKSAYQAYLAANHTYTNTISGTIGGSQVTGSGTQTEGALASVPVSAGSGFTRTGTTVASFSYLSPATGTPQSANTTNTYTENYNSNKLLTGTIYSVATNGNLSTNFVEVQGTQQELPASVTVGSSANWYSTKSWTDSTKTTPIGTSTATWTILSGSGSNAVFQIVSQNFDTNNAPTLTTTARYSIDTTGTMKLLTTRSVQTVVGYLIDQLNTFN